MSGAMMVIVTAVLSGAIGFLLVLPAGRQEPLGWKRRLSGILILMVSLCLVTSRTTSLGNRLADSLFYVIAAVTIISGGATITMRKPVYAALWFGMTLLGTAGLFLLQGAQFLAVATIVVYAGAILVTYLFVLILAQPEGRASYDRTSVEPILAAVIGTILIGLLVITIDGVIQRVAERETKSKSKQVAKAESAVPFWFATDPDAKREILTDQHVARLGTELFARHLVAVEVAGVLLFVALVGATSLSHDIFSSGVSATPKDQAASET